MARKSAATLIDPGHPQPVVIDPVRKGHYSDYPECLPRFKWLVEDAIRTPDRMFNSPTVGKTDAHYCKCCGAAYRRSDFAGHVNEHAAQLKILDRVVVSKNGEVNRVHLDPPKVDEELKLTIIDSLTEKVREIGLEFTINTGLLGHHIAKDIETDTGEFEGDPPLCADCL